MSGELGEEHDILSATEKIKSNLIVLQALIIDSVQACASYLCCLNCIVSSCKCSSGAGRVSWPCPSPPRSVTESSGSAVSVSQTPVSWPWSVDSSDAVDTGDLGHDIYTEHREWDMREWDERAERRSHYTSDTIINLPDQATTMTEN